MLRYFFWCFHIGFATHNFSYVSTLHTLVSFLFPQFIDLLYTTFSICFVVLKNTNSHMLKLFICWCLSVFHACILCVIRKMKVLVHVLFGCALWRCPEIYSCAWSQRGCSSLRGALQSIANFNRSGAVYCSGGPKHSQVQYSTAIWFAALCLWLCFFRFHYTCPIAAGAPHILSDNCTTQAVGICTTSHS